MRRTGTRAGRGALGAAVIGVGVLAAAGLTGCRDEGRVDAPEPPPLAVVAPNSALPAAPPASVARWEPARGYAWAEQAYGLQDAVYDAPPDYGFTYGDVEPLAWTTDAGYAVYAEPWGDEYRYYYYQPGAAYPFFVRDIDYAYGFGPEGALVAVFDSYGRYQPVDVVYRVAPMAGRFYTRGVDIRRVAIRAPRLRIDERAWTTAHPRLIRSADPWMRAARSDRQWLNWRQKDADRTLHAFSGEKVRRERLQKVNNAGGERADRVHPGRGPRDFQTPVAAGHEDRNRGPGDGKAWPAHPEAAQPGRDRPERGRAAPHPRVAEQRQAGPGRAPPHGQASDRVSREQPQPIRRAERGPVAGRQAQHPQPQRQARHGPPQRQAAPPRPPQARQADLRPKAQASRGADHGARQAAAEGRGGGGPAHGGGGHAQHPGKGHDKQG